jgi:cell filamentation protein
MASKYHLKDSSLYIKGSEVPKNKLNITDTEIIREIEKELLEEAYLLFYDELNEETCFDENYFINLHKRTFELKHPLNVCSLQIVVNLKKSFLMDLQANI